MGRAPVFLRKVISSLPFVIIGSMALVLLQQYGVIPERVADFGQIVVLVVFAVFALWLVYDDFGVFTGRVLPTAKRDITVPDDSPTH